MKIERKIEILQYLIFEYMRGETSGLCSAISMLWDKGIINSIENMTIKDLLYQNRPYNIRYFHSYFYKPYKIAPRIKFLDKLIKKLKDKQKNGK